MREYETPFAIRIPPEDQLATAVFRGDRSDLVLFDRPTASGGWEPVTATVFATEVRALAAGFLATGIQPGERVALLAATSYEWTLTDYALWTIGAVPVPVYDTSSPEQIQWVLENSEAVATVVGTAEHRQRLEDIDAALPGLDRVWQMDAGDLSRLREEGAGVSDAQVDERRDAVRAEDTATIIYTSGTTGRPKGCVLTHANLLYDARAAIVALREIFDEDASTVLFLPLAHAFARIIEVACVEQGVRLAHTADLDRLPDHLAALRPTFILSVPRVLEKVHSRAQQRAQAQGRGRVFGWAEEVAVRHSRARERGGRPGRGLSLAHRLFERLVYRKLKAALGGRVAYVISGGAPLGTRLGHFFRGIGVTVLEGYGLTETSAAATVNQPTAVRIGTVGRPLPGVTVRIAEDGEILLRGPVVFPGYWRNETVTKETLSSDGWLHTGDVGALDDKGFLTISGRKKEIIVTAGGKNVLPTELEDRLRADPLVSQAVPVGDRRPYIAGLITLDEEELESWKKSADKPADATPAQLRDDPDLLARLQAVVDEANATISPAERMRRFRVLPNDLTEADGYLTPTLKVRRARVLQDFATEIDALYRA
ncbi:AMP-dependent synthetase/ligase [Streptomyces malaysiensis]|uniref:Acyl-CoA synthetase n=1 Tax=Streptomyces malaysiensis TaxID=92644 RepID=A0A7X5WWG9_STRMQ|nr:long-chain fatty acid--CoA ligase [Streptomyces malaysiensis]NIY62251.1 AMP-dependent synthetase and ligase [Streptomyces malaysiensis]